MCATWAKEQRSEQLVNSLLLPVRNQFHFDANGNVSGSNFSAYHDLVTAIMSYLTFDPDIPENEKFRLLSSSVWATAKTKKLDARTLLGQLTKQENDYFKKPKIDFELATSISVKYFSKLSRSSFRRM